LKEAMGTQGILGVEAAMEIQPAQNFQCKSVKVTMNMGIQSEQT
jgi:hypothetical protein